MTLTSERLDEYAAHRIKCVEKRIADEYAKKEIQTPIHLCLGEETIAVTICSFLKDSDPLFAYYRSHGWYLAKGGDLKKMIAELYGKSTGCSGGYGGSMHLIDRSVGFHGTTAIVGAQLAHAVGAAFAIKMQKQNRLVTCVFGDGATEQGIFMESLMFAALHRLPILFICMNNGFAVNTPKELRQPKGTDIANRARSFDVPAFTINYPQLIRSDFEERIHESIDEARYRPKLLEIVYQRKCEHVGPRYDQDSFVESPELKQEIDDAFMFAKESAPPTTLCIN